jgi:ABC-type polysaccharide/polyol phosphate export permease
MSTFALRAVRSGFLDWRIWQRLAFQDIVLRYRRSSLGPFWITLSMAIRIAMMGFLYGHLFKANMATYVPYLAAGVILWGFISTTWMEITWIFVESEGYLRNILISHASLVMRVVIRNIIILLHNALAYLPVLLFLPCYFGLLWLLLIPGLLILAFNAFIWGMVFAILGVRFRDLPMIVDSLIQILFFVTPIMWMPAFLPQHYQWVIFLNPVYQLIELMRGPLMGIGWSGVGFGLVACITVLGCCCFYYLVERYESKVIFWL